MGQCGGKFRTPPRLSKDFTVEFETESVAPVVDFVVVIIVDSVGVIILTNFTSFCFGGGGVVFKP